MGKLNAPTTRTGKYIAFSEAFEEFMMDSTARGLSEKTLYTYRNHLHCISLHLDISTPLAKLTKEQLNEMVVSMRGEGLASNTIKSYTRVVKTFLNWCNRQGYTSVRIQEYRAEETIKETYTDEELIALLERPEPTCRFTIFRNWVIVNFLLNSGCRAGTIRNIQNGDVDLAAQQVLSRHNKNGKVQAIPLCQRMATILREYKKIRGGAADDYLFCDEFGEQMSENALRLAIARCNRSRGVEKTSIHLFRHTFARKYLVDCGGNAFTLQRLLGHSTLQMTKHYCNIFDADITKNYDKFSPLAQMKVNKERIVKSRRK